jgi:hypothetical protein
MSPALATCLLLGVVLVSAGCTHRDATPHRATEQVSSVALKDPRDDL